MLRMIIAVITLVVLPVVSSASTYACAVKQRTATGGEPKDLWSGKIGLKDGPEGDAAVFVIGKNGNAIPITDIAKNSMDYDAMRAAMKPYDGLLVIGLRKQKQGLDLNLGHVDTSNNKDSAPMDVDAWSSPATKEIGVTDVRKHLAALCRLE